MSLLLKNCNNLSSLIISMVIVVLASSCVTGTPHYISQRDPGPNVAPVQEISIAEPTDKKPMDLFVRQKDVKIRRKAPANETGSLTDLNDPRAYLFGFERPVEVGMFIEVKIASNRSGVDAPGSQSAAAAAPAGAGKPDATSASTKEVDVDSMLKALPSLEPAPENKPILLKSVKMQVLERFDNGDVLVMHRRRSIREGQGAEIGVTARLPAEALARLDNVSTLDLADVDWRESSNGELAERKSANWEDEYSLRLSGFDETKSKDAMSLDEKREKLKTARDKLENEMKGFAGERTRLANERAKLLESKAKDGEKISELEKQNAELKKQVEDLAPKEEAKLTEANQGADAKNAETAKADPKSKDQKPNDKAAAEPAAPAKPAPKKEAQKAAPKPAADKKKG